MLKMLDICDKTRVTAFDDFDGERTFFTGTLVEVQVDIPKYKSSSLAYGFPRYGVKLDRRCSSGMRAKYLYDIMYFTNNRLIFDDDWRFDLSKKMKRRTYKKLIKYCCPACGCRDGLYQHVRKKGRKKGYEMMFVKCDKCSYTIGD